MYLIWRAFRACELGRTAAHNVGSDHDPFAIFESLRIRTQLGASNFVILGHAAGNALPWVTIGKCSPISFDQYQLYAIIYISRVRRFGCPCEVRAGNNMVPVGQEVSAL